jgi:5'-3' exonuclease
MSINILFDSSFVLHRNLFSLSVSSETRFLDSEQDVSLFVRKVIDDLNSIVAIFPKSFMKRLVWARDSRSWRKELIEGVDYKGTRVKDETKINWDEFRRISNELSDVLSECGFIVSSEQTAEADDLLYLWSQHLLNNGESSIIVTSDKDLNQCLRFTPEGHVVCTYNPMNKNKRFTFHHEMENFDWSSRSDIDDLFSDRDESSAERLFKISQQYEQEFVNPYQVSIEKIFEGDKSDNVPSALQWKKGDRTYSFTPRMMGILMEGFSYDEQFLEKIRYKSNFRDAILYEAIAITQQDIDIRTASQSLLNNISLMYLDRSVIPETINVSNFDEPKKVFDLRDTKVYEIKPEWTYTSKDDGSISDIFSMME